MLNMFPSSDVQHDVKMQILDSLDIHSFIHWVAIEVYFSWKRNFWIKRLKGDSRLFVSCIHEIDLKSNSCERNNHLSKNKKTLARNNDWEKLGHSGLILLGKWNQILKGIKNIKWNLSAKISDKDLPVIGPRFCSLLLRDQLLLTNSFRGEI